MVPADSSSVASTGKVSTDDERLLKPSMFMEPGELLGRVLDALEAPVVVLDAAGRVLLVNRAAERLSGRCAAAVFGESFACAFVAEPERPEAQAALDRLLAVPPAEKVGAEKASGTDERDAEEICAEEAGVDEEASGDPVVLAETRLEAGERQRLIRWSARRVGGDASGLSGASASGDGLGERGSGAGGGAVVTGLDRTRESTLEHEAVSAEEQLRRRFGAELHDMLASHLAGTAMMASALARKIERGGAAQSKAVRRLTELIREAMEQVRALSHSFVAPELENEQLGEALEQLVARTETASGVTCGCEIEERAVAALPDGEVAVQLYRIAQEALSNAVRHAEAHWVRLLVKIVPEAETRKAEERRLVMEVRDDGMGLPEEGTEGVGLRNMRRRAKMMGAKLEVKTAAGEGTCVRCILPLAAIPAAPAESPGGREKVRS